jgi:hypothetical protein
MAGWKVTSMAHTPANGRLAAIGEIVLAPFSFLLYRTTRFLVQRLVHLQGFRPAARAARWQALDGHAVGKPFNRLAFMTSAPRWNTHALIALTGPVQVRHTLRIHAATAATSAASWTVVVHAEPAHRIVATVGSLDVCEGPWRSVDLPPGVYRLALRYYRWSEPVVLPAVEVDGAAAVDAVAIAADTNTFYHDLNKGGSLLYLCLHSYVCTLLRHRRWFPRAFVAREYLPAGNPQTTFYYGFLSAGTRLDVELDDDLLQTHDAYFTAYNRASFPILWYPLIENRHITPRSPVNGSYLIRLHARAREAQECERDRVHIRILPGGLDVDEDRPVTEVASPPPAIPPRPSTRGGEHLDERRKTQQ